MDIITIVITIISSVLASSGLWALISTCVSKKDARTQVLIGLGHDRIIFLGMSYLERGWIYESEYENLHDYLYLPYKKLGGNGSAEKIMEEVKKLPVKKG